MIDEMANELEQQEKALRKKVTSGMWLMFVGALVMMLFEKIIIVFSLGVGIAIVGSFISFPAIRKLRQIGAPVPQAERRRKFWLIMGFVAAGMFGSGLFYSHRMTDAQPVIFWASLIGIFSMLILWGWRISKGWTKLVYQFDAANEPPKALRRLHTLNTNSLRYAGFGSRLGSLLLDGLIMAPLTVLVLWASSQYRLFQVYYLIPGNLFGLFYSVYLIRRFGGTPGKLIMGIRVRKLDGEPVGYREAFLRYFPDAMLCLVMSIAWLIPLFHMSDAEYGALTFMERSKRMAEYAPFWSKPVHWVQVAWIWGELIVLLTNKKRRALHDFIAGTVVVHASPIITVEPTRAPEGASASA